MRFLTTSLVLTFVSIVGCSSVDNYCDRKAECADCTFTADVCDAQRQGDADSCLAGREADMNSTASGSAATCDQCNNAREEFYACAVALESCAAFKDAGKKDKPCFGEKEAMDGYCDQEKDLCWK